MQEVSRVSSHHFGRRSGLHIPECKMLEDLFDDFLIRR
jgi:hypothetical protein